MTQSHLEDLASKSYTEKDLESMGKQVYDVGIAGDIIDILGGVFVPISVLAGGIYAIQNHSTPKDFAILGASFLPAAGLSLYRYRRNKNLNKIKLKARINTLVVKYGSRTLERKNVKDIITKYNLEN